MRGVPQSPGGAKTLEPRAVFFSATHNMNLTTPAVTNQFVCKAVS
jgi:hypothetical protein